MQRLNEELDSVREAKAALHYEQAESLETAQEELIARHVRKMQLSLFVDITLSSFDE